VQADPGTVVAAIGQGGQVQVSRGPVQRAEDLLASCGQVVHRTGHDVADPLRCAGGCAEGWDVAAVLVGFAGVPQVDLVALDAGGLLQAPVGGEDLPSRIT
jgi:hypothetical protein